MAVRRAVARVGTHIVTTGETVEMKRKYQQIGAVVIVLGLGVLSGCSDDTAAAPPPAARSTGATPTPSEPVEKPVESTPPATEDTAQPPEDTAQPGADAYCERVQTDGNAIGELDDEVGSLSPAEKAKIKAQLTGLASAAPGDVKPAMEAIATGYGKLMDGEITAENTKETGELAAAIMKFGEWMTKNCAT
jgi:hypothetical protein